jgi:hypothetical protein
VELEFQTPTKKLSSLLVFIKIFNGVCVAQSSVFCVFVIPCLPIISCLFDGTSVSHESTSRSLLHSRLITGFVTRLTRRVPLVEQELLTLPEHMSSPPVYRGVRVTRSHTFVSDNPPWILFSKQRIASIRRV